jgi:hypothetical protein
LLITIVSRPLILDLKTPLEVSGRESHHSRLSNLSNVEGDSAQMTRGASNIGKALGCALSFGLSIGLAGCGGETTTPKTDAAPSTPAASAPSTPAVKTKGKGGALAEGGEVTAQERRAAKLKEKKAAGQ